MLGVAIDAGGRPGDRLPQPRDAPHRQPDAAPGAGLCAALSTTASSPSRAADEALSRLEVDQLGLDATDRRMLRTIIQNYGGGPVGLETLAATIGEEAVTLEDVYEPYLMQLGFLTRTPRGRCVTRLAYEHLQIEFEGQLSL